MLLHPVGHAASFKNLKHTLIYVFVPAKYKLHKFSTRMLIRRYKWLEALPLTEKLLNFLENIKKNYNLCTGKRTLEYTSMKQ